MIIVMKKDATKENVEQICSWLESHKVKASPIYGKEQTVIGLVGDTSDIDVDQVAMQQHVDKVMKVQEPYKKTNRKFHPDNSIIDVGGVKFGESHIPVIAGPCSVESEEQIIEIARSVKASGASLMRGGAFKPRTSPYSFQGLKAGALIYLGKAREATGLPVVSEITNISQIEMMEEYVDLIQVGARNMQNFELMKALGHVRKPILLKRGFSNTIEELLMSAEYIMSGGNEDIILCERGIRTFETSTRNTLDISAIPVLKKLTHLPVIVDPSHAGGRNDLVEPLAMASIAAGADGLIIEVHNDPAHALSDGPQSLTPEQFSDVMKKLDHLARAVGRSIIK
ncbi:3-deoxy-7-phosphoheptulonate synthase [Parasporobacterium paucivorans]|uniref:3-deoxy-D-arabinoheptulosonate-7-phosphate synthase n=1 Tax=Parasporobacterium paucivorans DSM 15970 TaxID=1122934 RepID=A0A1M6DPN3_9FIRM|nr:3-deoxy-7-phosphoheptulonate synthase [Parasporobacterium paucivorans]SHI75234.1 3-deoxy-D-arabinoheptulosonate-7-phosphate synthase [Parasporobacterium paucivorans DSM 15970]